jgi:hypothetical protein
MHAKKAYGGKNVYIHSSLALVLDGSELSLSSNRYSLNRRMDLSKRQSGCFGENKIMHLPKSKYNLSVVLSEAYSSYQKLSKILKRGSANQNLGCWLKGHTTEECKSKYCILLKRSSNGERNVKCCLLMRYGLMAA